MGKLLSVAVLAMGLAAAGVQADEAEVKAASAKVKNQALKDHLLQNIDIFGKNDLPAVYILAPGEFADEEIKGQLDPAKFWNAWERGSQVSVDLFSDDWNFWDAAQRPLTTLRREYGVPALDPQYAAHGTVPTWYHPVA